LFIHSPHSPPRPSPSSAAVQTRRIAPSPAASAFSAQRFKLDALPPHRMLRKAQRVFEKSASILTEEASITASGPLDAEQTLRYESFRYGLGVWWRRCCRRLGLVDDRAQPIPCSRQCDLLSTPDGLPMAAASGRIPSVGHRLSLFPHLEEHGRVDLLTTGDLRANALGSWSKSLSICGYHG
jgi:hypothetical protein